MEYEVSVCCVTYNQEKYIRKCLEGIFSQKTAFPFEVVVHDDKSSDGTLSILREFQERYGNRMRIITETENQYSQGKKIFGDVTFPYAGGRYIATCEGDDFWCDSEKLQRQYEAMQANPNASWCVHRVQWVQEDGTPEEDRSYPSEQLCAGGAPACYSTEQMLELVCREGFQLSSYFVRNAALQEYIHRMPDFVKDAPVEDEVLVRYLVAHGETVFLPRIMSCYRQNSVGSWTVDNMAQRKKEAHQFARLDRMLEKYDAYTGGQYTHLIGQDRNQKQWRMYAAQGNYRKLLGKRYRSIFRSLSVCGKLRIVLRACLQK